MSFSDTKDKLEQYRKKKLKEESYNNRKEVLWNLITFQSLRRRNLNEQEQSIVKSDETSCDANAEECENKSRTNIDWAILFVKLLVWVCLQVSI